MTQPGPAQGWLLALDAAARILSLCLMGPDGTADEWLAEPGVSHSRALLPGARALLARHGLTPADLALIACGVGPGTFIGTRSACSAAQGMAWALDLPTAPVSDLRALTATIEGTDAPSRALTVLDARMGQVYAQPWAADAAEPRWRPLSGPVLVDEGGLPGYARSVGADLTLGAVPLSYRAAAASPWREARPSARHIAALACADWRAGRVGRAQDLAPLYVRDRVALTIAERRRGEKL